MNKDTLQLVKSTAQLLINRIDKILELSNKEICAREKHNINPNRFFTYDNNPNLIVSGTKANGALKRVSIELTRLLADLRQNR